MGLTLVQLLEHLYTVKRFEKRFAFGTAQTCNAAGMS